MKYTVNIILILYKYHQHYNFKRYCFSYDHALNGLCVSIIYFLYKNNRTVEDMNEITITRTLFPRTHNQSIIEFKKKKKRCPVQ